ncbi:uncharacterized protein LOC125496051 isoform X2 [Beta vulgaris subsp. vulgaris]|uniref:uncharacterized protein LOC125496051 isoform X2 n=1 Tax=Beta vulgaris subsp. vulgaris TaxID=3555 RepID=UPI0025492F95|nr:uncharacterized protein LOC125496051 isoform X2 [Beta vulgaris subsp. vulgaris]
MLFDAFLWRNLHLVLSWKKFFKCGEIAWKGLLVSLVHPSCPVTSHLAKGLNCTYIHINVVSYSMHEVTRIFLGAASILSNGTVYSRVGTACVAMMAHAFHVPVLVCCEAYKFHERVQLNFICFNELGDPDVILKVPGTTEINYLSDWTSSENLQLLNLICDITPSNYISMIITDYGMGKALNSYQGHIVKVTSLSVGLRSQNWKNCDGGFHQTSFYSQDWSVVARMQAENTL